jgi:transcriptional regulator with XRE-family HTH domain
MLTEFGRYLRKLRIDCGELIRDMAEKLGVTASYLSAVETGKRNIPEAWVKKISILYKLDSTAKAALEQAAINSTRIIKMNIDQSLPNHRKTAVLFAREFENLEESVITQIQEILRNSSKRI